MKRNPSPMTAEAPSADEELNQFIIGELSAGREPSQEQLRAVANLRELQALPAFRNDKQLNAYLSAAIPGVKSVSRPMGLGEFGFVDERVPDVMNINQGLRNRKQEVTKLHEQEHLLKNRAVQALPERERIDNDIRFDQLYGDESGRTRREIVSRMVRNRDKIEKFFGMPIGDSYFNESTLKRQGRSMGAMFEEQIATLSALEQVTGKSLTKGMPDLFPDDKAAAIYDAITGLRQTRLDAKDLPPYTPQYESTMDWVKKKLRFRAEGSPEYGEVATQMTVGTPIPAGEEPGLARQGLELLKQAGKTVYGNLREAVVDPRAFHTRALGNVAKQLETDPQEFIMNWTGGGLGGIIRPKGGGNLLSGEVERVIEPLIPTVGPLRKPASDVLAELKKVHTPENMSKLTGSTKEHVERAFRETERTAALEDWIKTKFAKYVKSEMGTEADPIRKLADEMSEKVQGEYQAGLKRIAKMKDDIAKAKAKGKNTDLSEAALADEIDRVEEAFQSASILPIQLGPYTHVSAKLGEKRERAGMSPYPVAKSSQGKAYEELADDPFIPMTVEQVKKSIKTRETMGPSWAQASENVFTKNPWAARLKDEDVLYRLNSNDINEKQIFTHTLDELQNALNPNSGLPPRLLLKPEDMQQLSIDKAFRHVNNINDWRMQQRVAANLAEAQRSAQTIKEYPETPKKLKWQQLKPMEYTELPPGYRLEPRTIRPNQADAREGSDLYGPDGEFITTFVGEGDSLERALTFIAKNDLEKALKYEGSTMRHCVGGYCPKVYSGETKIFSLRDKKGEPHVTIETAPPQIGTEGHTTSEFLKDNPEMVARLGFTPDDLRVYEDWNYSRGGYTSTVSEDFEKITDQLVRSPEFMQWAKTRPEEILQVKGKGNGKPAEQYMPFIQDFIRSQQWSRIGDIQNAELYQVTPGQKLPGFSKEIEPGYYTLDEFKQMAVENDMPKDILENWMSKLQSMRR